MSETIIARQGEGKSTAAGQVIGHEWAVDLLLHSLERERVSHATLIVGPPNVGKTTLARLFAQALNCTGEAPTPCGVCPACRKINSGNHPDVRIFDSPNETLKIEQIRELQRELSLSPYEGRWRVAVLCDFERATLEAANALLKTLEEPSGQVALMLTAQHVDGLLPTIVSRCQVVTLRPLPIARVSESLRGRGVETAEADTLAHLSRGRLGWAVRALEDDMVLARRDEDLDRVVELLDKSRVERLAYAASLSRDPGAVREVIALWVSWWHDLLLLTSGSQAPLTNVDRLPALQQHATQVTLNQARHMLVQLQAVLRSLEQNVNLRLALDVLMLSWPRSTASARA